MSVADHMREFREQRGLSQQKLSALSGIQQSCICSYEKGKTMPNLRSLMAMCLVMGCTIDEYVGTKYDEVYE